jgi:hypothetical protein
MYTSGLTIITIDTYNISHPALYGVKYGAG